MVRVCRKTRQVLSLGIVLTTEKQTPCSALTARIDHEITGRWGPRFPTGKRGQINHFRKES